MSVQRSVRKLFRIGAVAFVLMSMVPGYYFLKMHWVPAADFDIIGILWLITNAPRILAGLFACGGLATAFYCLVRGLEL